MGLTVADVEPFGMPQHVGALRMRIVDVTWDTSYPTGGEALTPEDVGLEQIVSFVAEPRAGIVAEWQSDKLLAYWSGTAGSALDEVTNGTNLALVTHRCMIFGV